MESEFLLNDELQKISIEKKDGRIIFSDGKRNQEADIHYISPHEISVLIGEVSCRIFIVRDKDCRYVFVDGRQFVIKEPSEEREDFHKGDERTPEGTLLVKAPMPGKVIKVIVAENDQVRKNQTLAIVEAMKMENEIKASVDGTIKAIHVSPGDLVDSDKLLLELEPS